MAPALLAASTTAALLLTSDPGTGPPRARPTTSTPSPAPPQCTEPDLTSVDPAARAFWKQMLTPVHRAACTRDYRRLASFVQFEGDPSGFTTAQCAGCSSAEIVGMWRQEYGFRAEDLARLLETRPLVEQGGLRYQHGRAVAWFARGTYGTPGQWTAFYPDCTTEPGCSDHTGTPPPP
ncbi:hypothetical protein [Streptomyces sp. NPDC049906]|uniref:hypothetical protein n=1 Tax=Streptomyces sp. NPDC049906 TaxID=3155656 RepID=UPI0034333BB1